LRPLVQLCQEGEVAVEDGGASALALLDREAERLPNLLDALLFAVAGAGAAAVAELG
jgi:hypothetical protein